MKEFCQNSKSEEIDNKSTRGRQWDKGAILSLHPADIDNKKISVTNRVYLILRQAILTDHLPHGSWLRQDDISNELSVSKTPIREALRILSREGLIEFVSNYGAKVSELSIEEFEEIYAVRKGIEGLAICRAVPKLLFEKINELKEFYNNLADLAKHEKIQSYLHEEWQFRMNIYKLGSSNRFLSEIQDYRDKAERYLQYAYNFEESIFASYRLHYELLIACEKGNVLEAEIAVHKALDWTLKTAKPVIMQYLNTT